MIIRCFSACKRYQRCTKCQMILLPLYIHTKQWQSKFSHEMIFKRGEGRKDEEKNQRGILPRRKGRLDAVGAVPGACDVGNNLVPPPLSPMQAGPSSPNFHGSPPLVFAAAWAHPFIPSGTEPMRPWLSLSYWLIKSELLWAMAPLPLSFL